MAHQAMLAGHCADALAREDGVVCSLCAAGVSLTRRMLAMVSSACKLGLRKDMQTRLSGQTSSSSGLLCAGAGHSCVPQCCVAHSDCSQPCLASRTLRASACCSTTSNCPAPPSLWMASTGMAISSRHETMWNTTAGHATRLHVTGCLLPAGHARPPASEGRTGCRMPAALARQGHR